MQKVEKIEKVDKIERVATNREMSRPIDINRGELEKNRENRAE